jgi:hypothetical protein
VEPVHGAGQQEIHRPQAEDREHIGGEHNQRLAGEREDGRHRVHREDDVAQLQEHQRHQQRRGVPASVEPDQERLAMEPGRHRHQPAEQPHHRVLVGVHLLVRRKQQLDAGEDQEAAEQEHHPRVLHQDRAQGDEHGAEDERADDAVEQDAVLVLRRDGEVREHHHEDEDVVHRQRLLDHVAGEELEAQPRAVFRPVLGHRVEVEAVVEGQRQRHPDDRPRQRLAERHHVRGAVEHAKVESQQRQHEQGEAGVERPVGGERKQDVHYRATWRRERLAAAGT